MTEQQTEQQSTPPAPKAAEAPKVYAAYDKDYLRFVGGTHPTKAKAEKAAKDRKVKRFEIREV